MERPSERPSYPPYPPYPQYPGYQPAPAYPLNGFDSADNTHKVDQTGPATTESGAATADMSQGIYPSAPGYPGYPPAGPVPYPPPYPAYLTPPLISGGAGPGYYNLPRPMPGAVPVRRSSPVKALLPVLSLIASFIVYAWIFGWQFGVGILVLLFVHEIGHYLVIRAKGLPAGLPVFIPLIGAYVEMRRLPRTVRDEAEIALAGPAAGALSGIACYLLYQWTQIPVFLPLAWFAFFLNLLNLFPIAPLDGGRIVAAISRWIWLLGLALVAVAFVYIDNPTDRIILLIMGWLGISQLRSRFRTTGPGAAYYRISLLSRAYVTLLYVGLAGALALGLLATQQTMVLHLLHWMP